MPAITRWPARILLKVRFATEDGRLEDVPDDLPVLTVADVGAWFEWLARHGASAAGVWLVLAKKGVTAPTSLTYEQALCHGWVDGQLARGDEATFRRRFTPRRPGSAWSQRNVAIVQRLADAGLLQPGGRLAVERARADGTWDAAYAGQASIDVPPDLVAALTAEPAAAAMFARLGAANRYAVLYRVTTAKRAATRQRRAEQLVAMLARGETIHPQ